MNSPRISTSARNMIERFEVSDEFTYRRRLEHLTWPGGASGPTGGIGYDFAYESPEQIEVDWRDMLTEPTVNRLKLMSGASGTAGLFAVKSNLDILIPWEAALHVFEHRNLPRYLAMTLKAFPVSEGLSPDSLGALVSLVFNRGPDCSPTDRRMEMHDIHAAISVGNYAAVPGLIRSMKRLWMDADGVPLPDFAGLLARRDEEAQLFEDGLDTEATDLFSPGKPMPGSVEHFNGKAGADAADALISKAFKEIAD